MKKFFVLVIMLFAFPFVVNAGNLDTNVCKGSAKGTCSTSGNVGWASSRGNSLILKDSSGCTFKLTGYFYSIDKKNVFCMDIANLEPNSATSKKSLKYYDPSVEKGLLTIYRLYLIGDHGDQGLVSTNDAMRLFVARSISYGKLSDKAHSWDAFECRLNSSGKLSIAKKAAEQIAGLGGNSINTSSSSSQYQEVQKAYCAAVTAAGYSDDMNTTTCKNAVKSLAKEKGFNNEKDFINFISDPDHSDKLNVNSKRNGDGDYSIFVSPEDVAKKMVEVSDKYSKVSAPSLVLSSITSCPQGFICNITSNKNLLGRSNGKFNETKLSVTRDPNFKVPASTTEEKVKFSFTYKFPWDVNSLVIVTGPSGDRNNVRQDLAYIDSEGRTINSELEIKVSVEPMCKTQKDSNGKTKYLVENKEVSLAKYIEAGCCEDITSEDIIELIDKSNDEKSTNPNKKTDYDTYLEKCWANPIELNPQDTVDIKQKCNMQCNDDLTGVKNVVSPEENKTFVSQFPMSKIMESIQNAEAAYYGLDNMKEISTEELNTVYSVYNRYTINDSGVPNNKYCKVYTSETMRILYPGYAISNSGRYFQFEDEDKPQVKVEKADIVFHINQLRHDRDAAKTGGLNNNEQQLWKSCQEYKQKFINDFEYINTTNGTFNYDQEAYTGSGIISTEVKLAVNNEKNTLKTNYDKQSSVSGRYGNVSKTAAGSFTLRPETRYYNKIGSGEIIKHVQEEGVENYVDIGYKYIVDIYNKKGSFTTNVQLNNLGNSGSVTKSIDFKTSNEADKKFECVYCNRESTYWHECPSCDEPTLKDNYIYRVVSLDDIQPSISSNSEYVSNWGDNKGQTAVEAIKRVGSTKLSAKVDDNYTDLNSIKTSEGFTSLENNNEETKLEQLEYIYSDAQYLEYEFNLNSTDLQIIKKNNRDKNVNYTYGSIEICPSQGSAVTTKSETAQYCYTCKVDGKECTSTFVTAFSEPNITTNTRKNKWKYYFYNKTTNKGEFKKGSISTLGEFVTGNSYSYDKYAESVYNENKNSKFNYIP